FLTIEPPARSAQWRAPEPHGPASSGRGGQRDRLREGPVPRGGIPEPPGIGHRDAWEGRPPRYIAEAASRESVSRSAARRERGPQGLGEGSGPSQTQQDAADRSARGADARFPLDARAVGELCDEGDVITRGGQDATPDAENLRSTFGGP